MGLVRPGRRARPANVKTVWRQLDRLFQKLAPGLKRTLATGARRRALSDLEKTIRRSVPQDVQESLLCHNGQKDGVPGCIFGNRLLPVADVIEFWKGSRGHDADAVPDVRIRSFPSGAVQLCQSHPGWLPLAADWNGNFIGVDLAPDLAGTRGQVIVFGRSESQHFVLASSWAEFLAEYADDVDHGRFEFLEHDGPDDVEIRYHEEQGDVIRAIAKRKKTVTSTGPSSLRRR
jgi:cell wall assembly regulator SMI1